ncbi:MAG TPA: hypothetical protein DIW30_08535 [Bacteroidales bacterium]|nr:hypothetical protein [Bacteroidales bacterium]
MKRNFIFCAVTLCLALGMASCGENEKQVEMTKIIPADAVTFSGKHKNLLTIPADVDSVKIMLVRTGETGQRWEVRALIPLQNTTPWKKVPGTDNRKLSWFEPNMGNLHVEYVDANESEVGEDVYLDYNAVESVLASDDIITEKALVKDRYENLGDKSYNTKRALFDKVAGISISKMELNEVKSAKSSDKKGGSSLSDIYEDAINEVADTYEKAMNEALNEMGL